MHACMHPKARCQLSARGAAFQTHAGPVPRPRPTLPQFCQCPPVLAALRPHGTDDMLFFVYTDEAAAAARSRLFVRRRQAKAATLPADLAAAPTAASTAPEPPARGQAAASAAAAASRVDWRASVLLMVVLQTAFRLSVVTAGDPELLNDALEQAEAEPGAWGRPGARGGAAGSAGISDEGGDAGDALRRVTKVVHASPRWEPSLRAEQYGRNQRHGRACVVPCSWQLARTFQRICSHGWVSD